MRFESGVPVLNRNASQKGTDIMMTGRSCLTAAAMILIVHLAATPASAQPQTPTPPASAAASSGSPASIDTVRTLPCQRFKQIADGGWIMTGAAQTTGITVENALFPKGSAEAAILSHRCLP
jgi:hypothetical protein